MTIIPFISTKKAFHLLLGRLKVYVVKLKYTIPPHGEIITTRIIEIIFKFCLFIVFKSQKIID